MKFNTIFKFFIVKNGDKNLILYSPIQGCRIHVSIFNLNLNFCQKNSSRLMLLELEMLPFSSFLKVTSLQSGRRASEFIREGNTIVFGPKSLLAKLREWNVSLNR